MDLKYLKCVKLLVRYIKKDSNKYQVVILLNSQNSRGEIVRQISLKVPSLVLNLKENISEKFVTFSSFENPRKTTLFILIDGNASARNKSISGISESLDFLNKLSPSRIRPKFLIISQQDGSTYEKLLRKMWSNFFLDVTVLELSDNETSRKAFIYYYDPFIDTYKRTKFSRKIKWFPDKLHDMNGFRLKAGLIDLSPYNYAKLENPTHLKNYTGTDVLTFDVLSKKLNFTTRLAAAKNERIGVCNTQNCTRMLRKCADNLINILITTMPLINTQLIHHIERTRFLDINQLQALVPILPGKKIILERSEFYTTIAVLILLIALIYAITRLLKFDYRQWHPMNIGQVLLGLTINQEPRSLAQRIFFMHTIILAFFCTSQFFVGFTSEHFEVQTEMKFNSIEDLDRAGFSFGVHPAAFKSIFDEAEGALLNLKTKSVPDADSGKWVEVIIKYKNASYTITNLAAKSLINSNRDAFGNPQMKVMQESFLMSERVLLLERHSPYVERVDEIVIRLVESGLRKKWMDDNFNNSLKPVNNLTFETDQQKGKLRRRLIFVIIHGYLLSIIIFIIEILIDRFGRIYL